MAIQTIQQRLTLGIMVLGLALILTVGGAGVAQAQQTVGDQPTAFIPPDEISKPEPEKGTTMKVLEAASWYLPNRFLDLFDIPRLYVTLGDGNGINLRVSKLMQITWFEDDAFCIGLTKRQFPYFGETISERYFGFLFAQQGQTQRDPTEVGIAAHLLTMGFNIALSAGEAVDAMLGIVGVDLMGDDHGPMLFKDDAVKEQPVASQSAAQAPAASQSAKPDMPQVPDEEPAAEPAGAGEVIMEQAAGRRQASVDSPENR